MADELLKLYGLEISPFVCRVRIALYLKGIKYEFVIEDMRNKSVDLIKYNPVHKKVPVLVHNGNSISESLVIIEYLDDVWKQAPILPQDAYTKAHDRFWAKFIDDKLIPALLNAIMSHGQEQAVAEAQEQLQFLENELKGDKFFGGDKINLVDISATFIAFWLGAAEEALGIKVCRVRIALYLKGIKYEFVIEDMRNKSVDLIKYNPVHKKVPVLVHNGNSISESLVIIEYLDDVWKQAPILPQDAYTKAHDRFWAKFIDDKLIPALLNAIMSHGQEQAVAEAQEQLQFLENELKGDKFFGGDKINLVDISATFIAFWLGAAEEALGIKVLTKDKFPKLIKWSDNYINCQVVKGLLPPREKVVALFNI
ncbi:hypothetical protein L1987_77445 [Smallanthus sonchifolius]|uniref:Uncharacterized protein n=1 Tax=Smallanthus sonchifolius TaxID=185202 RepID=A0ACB8ZEE6_9ASTR|nr:hypothetical protein L1987_77445 [Smallanthus sonchifolius]